jgi:hypothetical protein
MSAGVGLRRTVVLIAGFCALVSATGMVEAHLFHRASTLKYLLTVAAPLFVAVLAMVKRPIVVVAAVLLVAAPFAGFSMTFHGIHVPLLAPILLIGVLLVSFSDESRSRRSALAGAGLFALVMFVLPVIESPVPMDVVAALASLFVAAYITSCAARTREGFRTMLWAFAGSAVIQSGLAIWEKTGGHQLNLYGSAGAQTFNNSGYFFGYLGGTTRPPGAFYDPISLGNVLAIAVVLGAGLMLYYGMRRRWWHCAAATAAVAICIVGLEMTLSRMSWIGAAVGLVVAAALLPAQQRRAVLSGLVVVLASAALLGLFAGHSPVIQRLGSILHPLSESGTGQGDLIRVQEWHRALATVAAHPLAGIGFDRIQDVFAATFPPAGGQGNAQSTYLQIAAEGGALGILGLIAVLLALPRDLARLLARERLWGAVLCGACTAMLISWLTDITVRYSGVAACMGAVFGLVAGSARRVGEDGRADSVVLDALAAERGGRPSVPALLPGARLGPSPAGGGQV